MLDFLPGFLVGAAAALAVLAVLAVLGYLSWRRPARSARQDGLSLLLWIPLAGLLWPLLVALLAWPLPLRRRRALARRLGARRDG